MPHFGDSEPEREAHSISCITPEEFMIQLVYALQYML